MTGIPSFSVGKTADAACQAEVTSRLVYLHTMARWLLLFLLFAGAAAIARGGAFTNGGSSGLELAFWGVFGLAALVGVYYMLSAEHKTAGFDD